MKQVVVISGAASGIGFAAAKEFLDSGWEVIGLDLSPATISCNGMRSFVGNVSQESVWSEVQETIISRNLQISSIVHNAALQICKPFLETSISEFESTFRTNLHGIIIGTQKLIDLMTENSSIINIASVHALSTTRSMSAYAASKGAVMALTRSMAIEFADRGIRVNAVLPGAVETPMLVDFLRESSLPNLSDAELVSDCANGQLLRRVAQPAEIAKSIVFLSDHEKSSFITGHGMVVDGGSLANRINNLN